MKLPRSVIDRVMRNLVDLNEIQRGIVVAVSGGADSVALLHLIRAILQPNIPLIVAHLNHQFRGTQGDADEEFVKNLVDQLTAQGVLQIRCCTKKLDIPAIARRQGDNLEAVARRERYRWLEEIARNHGFNWVATGHTADDQAETVLHRLLRGSGLQGLRGIHPVRFLSESVQLVRPILQVRRDELIHCLQLLHQSYCEDQTNNDCSLTRNRIRHELLPQLKQSYNPKIVETLSRLAEQVGEETQLQQSESQDLLQTALMPRAGDRVILRVAPLIAAGKYRVRAALHLLWQQENWPMEAMDYASWQRLADLVFGRTHTIELPGWIRVRNLGKVIQIDPSSNRNQPRKKLPDTD